MMINNTSFEDLLSRRDCTDERAESTEEIAVASDVTCVESDDFSEVVHDTELLTLEISTDKVYREVLEVEDSEMVITGILNRIKLD